ncbi:N-acyl homoserine lactonase family protein [Aurantiacibacter spongiae]|uniref:N-acyl homoserine lactonase family protein n=1 Tax=Aurantiacibacter spongiae TaxID=2488860 RepID=A0A3N5CZG3_9SPHN|nr:N-acyl homoserine lactonase family protein [Aurantiacibacter spongiae]RPF72109.1 N-acyl homoserine lactonase family protein [Aurantiacibacter spongiae]
MYPRILPAIMFAALSQPAIAQMQSAEVTLTRIDCGRASEPMPLAAFDDTGASDAMARALVVSCYLVRHGDDLLIWDTGIDPATSGDPDGGFTMTATLVDELAALGIAPADVDYVGISHYHYDHTGQARDFPQVTLLIGAQDWEVIENGAPFIDRSLFAPWLDGGGSVRKISGDLDLFGDGTVRLLAMPGHTNGHHALLVRLAGTGPVMLTGDLAHYTENYEKEGVPTFNDDRADTLASFDRFKRMAANYHATVVIQHEPADVGLLPAFPEAAR